MKRGESIYYRHDKMNFLIWRDQNLLKLIFNHRNINEPLCDVDRYFENGGYKKIPVHPAVLDYFKHARYIDVINQYHYAYVIGRKSRHFSTRLMWWCIDVCIINAFQLYKTSNPKITHKAFRILLMKTA